MTRLVKIDHHAHNGVHILDGCSYFSQRSSEQIVIGVDPLEYFAGGTGEAFVDGLWLPLVGLAHPMRQPA